HFPYLWDPALAQIMLASQRGVQATGQLPQHAIAAFLDGRTGNSVVTPALICGTLPAHEREGTQAGGAGNAAAGNPRAAPARTRAHYVAAVGCALDDVFTDLGRNQGRAGLS